jgi:hypothetical protein
MTRARTDVRVGPGEGTAGRGKRVLCGAPRGVDGGEGRQADRVDARHRLVVLRRRARGRHARLRQGLVRSLSLTSSSQANARLCSVKLISGSLSHENGGNLLEHATAVCTLLLTRMRV